MRVGSIVFIVAIATSGSVLAQPGRDSNAPSIQERKAVAPIVLASVSDATGRAPEANATPTAAPPKHRIARVTTCRCGDPDPAAESVEQ